MAAPVITHNSPTAGSIAWTATNIQYAGESYVIPAGNTSKRFVWWKYNAGAPTITMGDTLPDGASTFTDDFAVSPFTSGAMAAVTGWSWTNTALQGSTAVATGSLFAPYTRSSRVTQLAVQSDITIVSDVGGNRRHVGYFFQTVDGTAQTGIRIATLDNTWVVSKYVNGAESGRITSAVSSKPFTTGTKRSVLVVHNFVTGVGYVQVDGETVFDYTLTGTGLAGRPGFFTYGNTAQFDNVKGIPTADALTIDDTLLFGNKAGTGFDATRTEIVDGSLIVGNSILADAIAANQITSFHILAGSIDATDIRAGSITSNQIKAGSILTADLAVADTYNYIANPFFNHEVALENWGFTGTGWVETTSNDSRIQRFVQKTNGAAGNLVNDSIIECRSGETLEVSALTFHISGAAVQIGVFWLNAALTAVMSEEVASDPVTAAWSEFRKTFVAPANCGGAVFAVKHTNTTGTVRVANPRFVRRFAGRLIVDGSIEADQLAANSVTSVKILAGSVDATKIAANTITADQIAANAIAADELAANSVYAAAIQTDAITARVIKAQEINAEHIQLRSITASRLALLGNNLLDNPTAVRYDKAGGTGTDLPPGWKLTSGALDWMYGNGISFRANANAVATNEAPLMPDISTVLGTEPIRYRAQAYLSRSSAAGTSAVIELGTDQFGTFTPFYSQTINDANPDVPLNIVGIDVPPGQSFAIRKVSGNASVMALYLNIMQMNTASMMVDGSITAGALSADAIDGKTITGATVRTSASQPASVKMSGTGGLETWKPDNSRGIQSPVTGEYAGALVVHGGGMHINGGANFINENGQLIALEKASNLTGMYTSLAGGSLTVGTWDGTQTFPSNPTFPEIKTTPRSILFRKAAGQQAEVSFNETNNTLTMQSLGGTIVKAANGNAQMIAQGLFAQASVQGDTGGAEIIAPGGTTLVRNQTGEVKIEAGSTSASNVNIFNQGSGNVRLTTNQGAIELVTANAGQVQIWPNGHLYLQSTSGNVYLGNAGSGAVASNRINALSGTGTSVVITSSGVLQKQSSSERYKRDIRSWDGDPYKVLNLEIKRFRYKDEVERWEARDPDDPDELATRPRTQYGAIAEEVHAAGVTEAVLYDQMNQPDGVDKGTVALMLVPIVRDLVATVKSQGEQIESLINRVAELTAGE